jgi:hypothetical protein
LASRHAARIVFRLAGEIIAFLYRLFLPSLKRGFLLQRVVFAADTIRAINAGFVRKFASTVVSGGSSLCPIGAESSKKKVKAGAFGYDEEQKVGKVRRHRQLREPILAWKLP